MPDSFATILGIEDPAEDSFAQILGVADPEGPSLGVEAQRFFPRLVSGARSVVGGLAETAGGGLAALGGQLSDQYVPVALQGPGRLLAGMGETLEEMGARAREQERITEKYDRPLQPGQTGEFFSDLADAPLTTLARDTPGVFGSLAASILTAGAAGPLAAGPALGISEQYGRARAEGQPRGRAIAEALPTGLAIGALESLSLGKILGAGRAKRLIRRIGEVSATEGGTEAAQSMVSEAGAKIRQVAQGEAEPADLDSLLAPEALRQYAAEGVLGAIGGGLAGAAIPRARSVVTPQEAPKVAQRAAQRTKVAPDPGLVAQESLVEDAPERNPGDEIPTTPHFRRDIAGGIPHLRDKASMRDRVALTKFYESASDTLRKTTGLEYLGDAIDRYFDSSKANEARMKTVMRPSLKAFNKLKKPTRAKVEQEFGAYFQAVHEGRDPRPVYQRANATTRNLIDSWLQVAQETGDLNDQAGVQVKDGRTWRPIGRVPIFHPRMFSDATRKALANPAKHPEKWAELVNALMRDGHIENADQAAAYIRTQTAPDVTSNDFFANMERARRSALPSEFYDFSLKPAIKYIERWADRHAQITHFGQNTGQGDLFDRAQIETLDEKTKDYVGSVKRRIYDVGSNESWQRLASILNASATGMHLSGPQNALVNLIGGASLSWMAYPTGSNVKALKDLALSLPATMQEAREFGVLMDDYMGLIHDFGRGAGDVARTTFSKYEKSREAVSRTVDKLLKVGGFHYAEQLARSHAMAAGKHYALDSIRAMQHNPNGARAKRAHAFFKRNGFNLAELAEQGPDSALWQSWLRKSAILSQSSYRVDQVPVFMDSPVGRFFLKYQKILGHINRMVWQNNIEPFLDSVKRGSKASAQDRALAFVNMMKVVPIGVLTGAALLELREKLFNYMRPGPGWDELVRALDDDDRARAVAIMAARAWHSVLAVSGIGLIGNYLQAGYDVTQRSRFKDPLDPPGFAALNAVRDVALRIAEEKPHRTGDLRSMASMLDDLLEGFFSVYRGYKRPLVTAAGKARPDLQLALVQQAEADRRYIAGVMSRWAEETGLAGPKKSIGDFGRTPMSPINDRIADALRSGDWQAASEEVKSAQARAPRLGRTQDSVLRSIKSSVRARQPINAFDYSISEDERQAFLRWAKKHVGVDNYQRMLDAHEQYWATARLAGLN